MKAPKPAHTAKKSSPKLESATNHSKAVKTIGKGPNFKKGC